MSSNARVILRTVRCSDDTEEGKDELYVLVSGSLNNAPFSKRLPESGERHWSIKDNNKTKVLDYDVHFAHIPNGGSMYIQFMASEADGQAVADTIRVAAEIAGKIPNPISMTAGAIVKLLPFPHNADDPIGVFSVVVTENGVEWAAGENARLERGAHEPAQTVYCTGSNTKYWMDLEVVRH